jgi:hypothetical protein
MVKGSKMVMMDDFDYYLSEKGRIYSLDGLELSTRIDRGNYRTVRLSKDGVSHTCFLHRLLGEAFVPKEEGKDELNHLSGDKLDNRLSNYEWTTHSGNVKHAYSLGLIDKSKISKQVIDTSTGQVFTSIKEASIAKGIKYATLKNYINGNRRNRTSLSYFNN